MYMGGPAQRQWDHQEEPGPGENITACATATHLAFEVGSSRPSHIYKLT